MTYNIEELCNYIDTYFAGKMSKKDIGKWAENAYYDLLKGSYIEISKIVLYPFLKTLSRIHIDNNDTEDIYPCPEKDVQEIRAVLHGEKAFDFRVEMAVPLQVYNMFSEKSYFNFEKREKIKMIKNDILCNPQHISINNGKLIEYISSYSPIENDTLLDILEDHIVKLCRNLYNTDICLKEENNLKLYPIKTNHNYLLEKLIDYLDCYLENRNFNILISYRNGVPDILLLVYAPNQMNHDTSAKFEKEIHLRRHHDMLETKELEKVIKSRILSVFPDFEFEFSETVKSRILSVFPDYDFELNKKINFGPRTNNGLGTVYIYTQDNKYHYISIGDRGEETHKEFISEDDVLYALLNSFIFQMALDYEMEHREDGKDFRRILFAKEIELYSKFGKEFEERKIAQINEILCKAPYHDEE